MLIKLGCIANISSLIILIIIIIGWGVNVGSMEGLNVYNFCALILYFFINIYSYYIFAKNDHNHIKNNNIIKLGFLSNVGLLCYLFFHMLVRSLPPKNETIQAPFEICFLLFNIYCYYKFSINEKSIIISYIRYIKLKLEKKYKS